MIILSQNSNSIYRFCDIVNGEKKFKPYYVAHTKIRTLALLDDKYKGSNWSNGGGAGI